MGVMLAFLTSVNDSEAQTILTTAGNVGGALTTNDFGIVTNFTSGTNPDDNRPAINWLVYSSSFVVLNGGNLWNNDNADGTSDDFVVAIHIDPATNPLPAFYFSGFPMAHYRIQAYNPPNDIHTSLTGGGANFNLANATNAVGGAQGEIGFQYSTESLEPNQAILYWLYPKPIKVNNSATSAPRKQ